MLNGIELMGSRNLPAPLHPTEAKVFPGSAEGLVGRNNELNASSNADMLKTIANFFSQMANGQIMSPEQTQRANNTPTNYAVSAATKQEKRQALIAAFQDKTNRSWEELGVAVGQELYETANRTGFMRRFFLKSDVAMGSIPRIRFNFKTQFAVAMASATQVQPLMARSKFLLPPEFYVVDNLLIEEREIFESTGDILEEKLLEAQEAVMVQEDKAFIRLMDALVGSANELVSITGSLTPNTLQTMRADMQAWDLPADTLLFATDIWNDILTGGFATNFYDPVSQYEIVQTGVIGKVLGLTLISDAYRVPQLRVLNQGQMYLLSRPEFLGAFTDRGPVNAQERNAAADGQNIPARGWFLWEMLSMTAPNGRAVVQATRSL